MPLIVYGLNHKTAPIKVREELAMLCGQPLHGVDGATLEAIPVFTCNRAEFYFFGSSVSARQSLDEYLKAGNLCRKNLEQYFYNYEGSEAIKHLFKVVAGLDSMVIGENQILHQIKESYTHSVSLGYVGKQLHSLFQKALEVGKKVRTETAISENRVSIASTAVELAKSIFGPLKHSNALIIGAGEMANLVALHLKENGVRNLVFVNRTTKAAIEMANKFEGSAEPFDHLEDQIRKADIVISSTAAPHTLIKYEMMSNIMPYRASRPIFIIDIALPRDVEPECGDISNLYLYDIDDLQNVVDENLSLRKQEAEKAMTIVNYEASQFQTTLETFTIVPIIKALREQAEQIRAREFARFLAQNPEISDEAKKIFEQHSVSIMNKLLHSQIVGLKKQGSADRNQLKLICDILGLPEEILPEAPIRALRCTKKEIA
ncbi:MAG: glutamyl-tRNA reductase [Candidatus Rifleibacteriota bacterium]